MSFREFCPCRTPRFVPHRLLPIPPPTFGRTTGTPPGYAPILNAYNGMRCAGYRQTVRENLGSTMIALKIDLSTDMPIRFALIAILCTAMTSVAQGEHHHN